MARYFEISNFLATHLGSYCAACLAQRICFSIDEVRAALAREEWGDITIAYGICQNCLLEREVVARRGLCS